MIDMHAWYEYEAGIPANLPHQLDAIDVQPCRHTPDTPRRQYEGASTVRRAPYSHLSRKALSRMALDAFCKLIRLTRS